MNKPGSAYGPWVPSRRWDRAALAAIVALAASVILGTAATPRSTMAYVAIGMMFMSVTVFVAFWLRACQLEERRRRLRISSQKAPRAGRS